MVQVVSIGAVLGVLAGIDTLLLLSPVIVIAGSRPTAAIVKLILQISSAILSLPAILFGGSWMSKAFLDLEHAQHFSECYTLSLAVAFLAIVVFPLARWVVKVGRSVGGP